jgi:uncharacterized repeat protein (TIGR03803 family)
MRRFRFCILSISASATLASCNAAQIPTVGQARPLDAAQVLGSRGQSVRTEVVLHRFKDGSDGAFPTGDLLDVGGTLYGTTARGGRTFCGLGTGCGTVYAVSTSGKHERVIRQFAHGKDGEYKDGEIPSGGLTDVNGALFGTTTSGGKALAGTVFKIVCRAARCSETVLHSFTYHANDGLAPNGDLIDVNGTLYGTTASGGVNGCGTVFSITPSGHERVLYRFKGGADSRYPLAGLTNVSGTLYGTTQGEPYGYGTVFKITTSGTETVLHTFSGPDGANPEATLTNVGGKLYGTTTYGGANWLGTVFSVTPSGRERVLHSFAGGTDGEYSSSPLTNVGGAFFGLTSRGGASGEGTIFRIGTSGGESILYSFTAMAGENGTNGENPFGRLLYLNGMLYGTTYGGISSDCSVWGIGCGTLFRIRV